MSLDSSSVEICYFGYNAFLVRVGGKTIAIDPGRNLSWSRPGSLMPKERWPEVDLILVTHGHPDHSDYVLHIAQASGAEVVCGEGLGGYYRGKGLQPQVLRPKERVEVVSVNILGVPVRHGSFTMRIMGLPLRFAVPARGSIGYFVEVGGLTLVTLGDTRLLESWGPLHPDIFLAPIGGQVSMDTDEARLAAEIFGASLVIPCHYNCPFWTFGRLLRADPVEFSRKIEASGRKALVLEENECISLKLGLNSCEILVP